MNIRKYFVLTTERPQCTQFFKLKPTILIYSPGCFVYQINGVLILMIGQIACQSISMQRVNWQWKKMSQSLYIDELIDLHFKIPLVIELLDGCRGFLTQVESAITDPIHLLASMASVHSVKMLLGKLTVGEITQTKTKTDILTQNTHCKAEYLAVALFFG